MIVIDGSRGEGGGQILRTSIALSALTMKPIRIVNIRAKRENPGLMRQHMTGIEVVGKITDAEIEGLEIGSSELEFVPRTRRKGRYTFDVGTAGSISLVLQTVLPAAILTEGELELEIRGGTDVAWSPPIDYMKHVFAQILRRLGAHVEIEQIRRGHYPAGGGIVRCKVGYTPQLTALDAVELGGVDRIEGVSHCVGLPSSVASRQAAAAASFLRSRGMTRIDIAEDSGPTKRDPHGGPGSGIVIWAQAHSGIRMGTNALGEKGKPAETVGIEAADMLYREISTGMAIDSHMGDMLIPYMALATGTSRIGVASVTNHLVKNIWVAREILGCKIEYDRVLGKPGKVIVEGIGTEKLRQESP
ncbi:MAG: RNA 3'-terminal phosphate cyclase [Candidatus Thorarchaeota archaeon]